jgi:hypothetical protein
LAELKAKNTPAFSLIKLYTWTNILLALGATVSTVFTAIMIEQNKNCRLNLKVLTPFIVSFGITILFTMFNIVKLIKASKYALYTEHICFVIGILIAVGSLLYFFIKDDYHFYECSITKTENWLSKALMIVLIFLYLSLQFSGIVLKALIEERGLIGLIRFKDCII